jgi:regulator-associated protein of mTOR
MVGGISGIEVKINSGAEKQKINVFNFNGDELSETLYYYGFLGHRIGPVSCLAFHPYVLG